MNDFVKKPFFFLLILNICIIGVVLSEAIPRYLEMQERHCPKGIYCFNDYFEGVEYAKKVNKPILLLFTGHAIMSDRKFENDLFENRKNALIIKNNFVLITLYVDQRSNWSSKDWFNVEYMGKTKTVKSIGDKWAYFQYKNFGQVSQPWLVLLSKNEKLLTKPIGRGRGDLVAHYNQFLKCGLVANRSLK